ncbi:MAG: TonB family protein [Candidatus Omnitrophica bacterium]|nr:TonB family protein [Candidatus Omnitrophota bacterium]
MGMQNSGIFKTAVIISFAGHCLVFGLPGLEFPLDRTHEPEEVEVMLEFERPPLLPEEYTVGSEKKIKEVEDPPEKVKEDPEPEQAIVEQIEEEPLEEKVEAMDSERETILRYQDTIKQKIEEARRYPARARRRGIEGVACLEFIVTPDGTSRDIRIIDPSGSKILDEEAFNTINRAGPFPPIPDNIRSAFIPMKVSIVFSLR